MKIKAVIRERRSETINWVVFTQHGRMLNATYITRDLSTGDVTKFATRFADRDIGNRIYKDLLGDGYERIALKPEQEQNWKNICLDEVRNSLLVLGVAESVSVA